MPNHDLLKPQEPRTHEIPGDPLGSQRKTVLVREDNTTFAEALLDILGEQGYSVTVVPSGVEGVERSSTPTSTPSCATW